MQQVWGGLYDSCTASSPQESELNCTTNPGGHRRRRGSPSLESGETETQRRPRWGWAPSGEMTPYAAP